MFFKKKNVTNTNDISKLQTKLLIQVYRYLSEYLLLLEYHDLVNNIDQNKINKIKQLKDDINNQF